MSGNSSLAPHSLYLFPEGQIIALGLIFLRVLAFFIAMPIIGTPQVPVYIKILLSLVFSILLLPVLHFQNTELIFVNEAILFFMIREIVIGLFLGYLIRMFFFSLSVAGEIVGVSSGLTSAQLYNPSMGHQGNVMEQFQVLLGSLLFLSLNGHHVFIHGFTQSFELLPISSFGFQYKGMFSIFGIFETVIMIGIKLSAPILISILMTNLAMGVLGRAVPQMNVLMTSLPITIGVGFAVLLLMIPFYINEMNGIIRIMSEGFFKVMREI